MFGDCFDRQSIFFVTNGNMGLVRVGSDDSCATVARVAMAFGVDDDGYLGLLAEDDDGGNETIGEHTLGVVGEDTGVQVVEGFPDTGKDVGLGLNRDRVSLFAVGTHHLLTMGENASLGGSGAILARVEMHGD